MSRLGDPFVERFAAAWRSHDPEQLGALLHPDVVLEQPMMAPLRGRPAAVGALARFLELMPDLEITIDDAVRSDDVVFIAFRFAGTVGKRRVGWSLVDRIELQDGLVRSRVSYFDPRPLLRAIVRQPSLWLGMVLRRRRRLGSGPRKEAMAT